ncbi:hypothetical protein ADIMK_3779 [Marinobacterium lacunae]|uniref:Helix-hairpin-helix DNA-binding motif class 1 domain-containing protein n=1 Tax=Marinobacterium lacunae TaxID=1232683 RepID=A0A081FUB3_9GAMM|nr:helix-hairpin-helix domain-containing protein [Marinobacterium lacunae]KEA62118.1 hypothetical protein ADIMK_3779 [Marinobacterium lacunae]
MITRAIRFNGHVEYRIEGDWAQLAADLCVDDPQQLENQRLSLQLLASPEPIDPQAPQGTRVAELPLTQSVFTGFLQDQALALPPAGDSDFTMAMALVGQTEDGKVQVHDCAVFNNRQLFAQPRIQGRVDCQLHDTSVSLSIDVIANNREADNRSGSLSLELWALNAPYTGGDFTGFPLASTELGTLDGQCEWRDCSFALDLIQPPVGEWALALMLREWTPAGFVTRDFRQLPSLVREAPIAAEKIAVETQPMAEFIAIEPTEAEQAVAAKAATEAVQADAALAEKKAPKKAAKAVKKPATKADKKKAEKVEEAVSINSASAKALSKVKGLSPRLADAIIAERPFSSVDDLQKVRGIGARMIARLRELLTL